MHFFGYDNNLCLISMFCFQDFTGVPAVVDLASMRDAMARLGGDSNKINPLVRVIPPRPPLSLL